MRANAILRIFDKLNAMERMAALEAHGPQTSDELPAELPALPDEAVSELPGRPDILPASPPELPGLPDEAMDTPAGRPAHIPTSRPELPQAAFSFCKETGLPMVAMENNFEQIDCEEPEDCDAM